MHNFYLFSIIIGLPAVFTQYETTFLVNHGLVEVVEKPQLRSPPSDEDKIKFQEKFRQQAEEIKQKEDDIQMDRFIKNIDKVVAGHQKSNQRKGIDLTNTPEETETELKERLIAEHKTRLASKPLTNRLIQIPFSHPVNVTSELVPSSELQDTFQYLVFKDLWHRGYTITPGETFGGTFLCYPGDPLHYHASHIVICCENGKLSFDNALKYARSSVIVNKSCVFAYQSDGGSVKYQTLEWISGNKVDDK